MSSISGNSISLDALIKQAMALTKQNAAPTATTMSSIFNNGESLPAPNLKTGDLSFSTIQARIFAQIEFGRVFNFIQGPYF
jgi:hypothetical protein